MEGNQSDLARDEASVGLDDERIRALIEASKKVFDLANHFNVSGVYFTEDAANREALQTLEDVLGSVDRGRV